jgi:hypothetical protein
MNIYLTDEVEAMGSINLEGNIIPMEWFGHLKLDNGKPDTISIMILSDIVYWYRPTAVRDEFSGKILGYKKKFRADILQRSYADFENLLGFSTKQTREALIRLESLGIIQRVFRTIDNNGTKLSNVMFLKIFPEAINKITNRTPISLQGNTYFPKRKDLFPSRETPISPQGKTNTKTTTKTTNNNSLSLKGSSVPVKQPRNSSENNERENEMIKIWNEIIEKNSDQEIKLTPKRKSFLNIRLKEFFKDDINLWRNFCAQAVKSKFLMGEVTDFRIQLDWALKTDNMVKIIEGSYHREGEQKELIETTKDQEQKIVKEIHESNAPAFWQQMMVLLMKEKGVDTFSTWFKKNQYLSFEAGILRIKAASKFVANWQVDNYFDDLTAACRKTIPDFKELKMVY